MIFKTSKILLFFLSLFIFSKSFALWIDHFNVKLEPENAKVWEALDITIEAMDKNNNVVSDYDWSILVFSESDPEADFPNVLKENSYTFSKSDLWAVKFENAVKFKNEWTQSVSVYEITDDSVFWYAEVEITKDDVISNEEISIISPENGITMWETSINVSWSTKKNHKIKIIVNSDEEVTTNSNSEWVYEKVVSWLKNWENSIEAIILDADDNVIWRSNIITIKVESENPTLKTIKVIPDQELEPEQKVETVVVSDIWLTDVSIVVDDNLVKLKETSNWNYKWEFLAPKEDWVYKIDVILKDYLWNSTNELWASSITVKKTDFNSASWSTNTTSNGNKEDPKNEVDLNSWDDKSETNRDPLKINWLTLTKLKTKSVLTWDPISWVQGYNVYKKLSDWSLELVDRTIEPRFEVEIIWDDVKYDYFVVKAEAKDSKWQLYEWDLSEATKIQTWPEIIILFLVSILLWWVAFVLKRKKA